MLDFLKELVSTYSFFVIVLFCFLTHKHVSSPGFSELIRNSKSNSHEAEKGGKYTLQETTESGDDRENSRLPVWGQQPQGLTSTT